MSPSRNGDNRTLSELRHRIHQLGLGIEHRVIQGQTDAGERIAAVELLLIPETPSAAARFKKEDIDTRGILARAPLGGSVDLAVQQALAAALDAWDKMVEEQDRE